MPNVLHVGCGGDRVPEWLSDFAEVRLDIDPKHKPDVVASMTDMGDIGGFSRLYCAHALEHLTPADGHRALTEFVRVLEPGGLAVVIVPDLEDIRPTDDVVYVSSAGPIRGVDMYYGLARLLDENPHMAHRNGFVKATLERAMREAGFSAFEVMRDDAFQLVAVGRK